MVSDLNKNFGGSTDLAKKRGMDRWICIPLFSPLLARYLLSWNKIGNFPWTFSYLNYILWRRAPLSLELFASSRSLISVIIDLVSFSPKTPWPYLEKGIHFSRNTFTFHRFIIICGKQGKTCKSTSMDPAWWFQKQINETKENCFNWLQVIWQGLKLRPTDM